MILTYGNILFIAIIIIILIFIGYLYFGKFHLKWDQLKIEQLETFIQTNPNLVSNFHILIEDKKKCFYNNFTKNVSYSTFLKIIDIRNNSKSLNDNAKIKYLNDNNEYQIFLLKILKYISNCLHATIDSHVIYSHLNDKIVGNDENKKEAYDTIAKQLNEKGYTLNQFNYLDKFYVDPDTNKSSAQVIKDFVDFLTKINKWAPKN
jgi:hypothetical protein